MVVYDLAVHLYRGECELCRVGGFRAADSTHDGTRRVPETPKRHPRKFSSESQSGLPVQDVERQRDRDSQIHSRNRLIIIISLDIRILY